MVNRRASRTRTRCAGFTLLEMMATMVVMSLLTAGAMSFYAQHRLQDLEYEWQGITAEQFRRIGEAAQVYSLNNGGSWPDEASSCASAFSVLSAGSYLPGMTSSAPGGGTYTTSCTTGTSGQFSISLDAGDARSADTIANLLPASTTSTSTVTAYWPQPAAIPALDGLLDLAGTRSMTGDLDAGGNYVTHATDVITSTGQSLAGSVQWVSTISPGDTVTKPTCPSGMTADAFVAGFPTLSLPSNSAIYSRGVTRTDLGATWQFNVTAVGASGTEAVNGSYVQLTVITQCI